MSIRVNEEKRTFTLQTKNTTYQMQIDPYGYLLHLYYGTKTEGTMDYLLTYRDRGFSGNPYDAGLDRTYSMDVLPQEFPTQGTGDFRSPLLVVRDAQGIFDCDLRFSDYEIRQGKYDLPGFPAVYEEEESEAQTLEVILTDSRLGLNAHLLYGVLPSMDIITRSVVLEYAGANKGISTAGEAGDSKAGSWDVSSTGTDKTAMAESMTAAASNDATATITIEKAQTACLDFVQGDFDITLFHGRHTLERLPERRQVGPGSQLIRSSRGTSSHQYNPFVILSDRTTTEESGRCYGMQLVYSGDFSAEASQDQFHQTRLQMGLGEDQFSYPLTPGKTLVLPEVILSYSNRGFAELSHNFHRCIRENVCQGKYKETARPLLLNSWEGSYFDFTGDSLLQLAEVTKDLGLDMLVMDDGWFGNRNDDYRGLGDWTPNEEKLGGSLSDLITKVNDMGLKFGIWMEPEMISEDSDLYREHPDWVLRIPGKDPVRARHQLVLDMARPDVADEVYHRICAVLDAGNIEYLKWDCNRNIADVYSQAVPDQGRVRYDFVKSLYRILEKLNTRYPDLLIEGCYGGGGRFDAGMLYYCPQIWCSDNTDPIDRILIQYGTSFGYPISAVGAHVSKSPNEQTGRATPLATRTRVAMAGSFGYELDPATLSGAERAAIRQDIQQFKADELLIRNGLYYRLTNPLTAEIGAWSFVSQNQDTAIITAVTLNVHGNMTERFVRPRGLQPGAFYRCQEDGQSYEASALMDMGFPLPMEPGEYNSYQFHLQRVEA